MRFGKSSGVVLVLLSLSLPLLAQEAGEPGNVSRIAWFQAKPGMQEQLESGIAQHMEWHKKVNDPWAWRLWQVVAGEKTGWLVGGVFGLHWADFDNPPVSSAEDSADADVTTRPFIGPVVAEYLEELPPFSRPPATQSTAPLLVLNVVRVRMGQVGAYLEAVRKTKEALEKVNHPLRYYMERVAYGGPFATFYFAQPVENWAGMAPPSPSFPEVLVQVYGEEEARRLMKAVSDATAEESNLILAYRPDLSYVPAEN